MSRIDDKAGCQRRDCVLSFFFFQAEDGIRDLTVTGVQTCALPISAERLGHPGVEDHRGDREPEMARDLGRCDQHQHDTAREHREWPHHAFTSAWPICLKAVKTVDSSLCAAFSVPPIAPGILKTIRSEARANRWWTGVMPSCSRASPTDSTKSCIGCMKRLVVKCELHALARCWVSGSMSRSPASGAVTASTTSTA